MPNHQKLQIQLPSTSKILLLGKNGQVGHHLQQVLSALGEVVAIDRTVCDLQNKQAVARLLDTVQPAIIVNASAYTAVDFAETEQQTCFVMNADLIQQLATWAKHNNALLFHYSTDYVFDGLANEPYLEDAPINPINVYGQSKATGERYLADSGCDYLCVRTTWVYDETGKNFVKTIIHLAKQTEKLTIVADQIGSPTYAKDIADITVMMLEQAIKKRKNKQFKSGIYHYTGLEKMSWFDFANLIVNEYQKYRPLVIKEVLPIPASSYPTPAKRPAYSGLAMAKIYQDYGIQPLSVHERLAKVIRLLTSSSF